MLADGDCAVNKSVALSALAWGLFIIMIGFSWSLTYYYAIDVLPWITFGTGLILIGLSAARTSVGLGFHWFSVFIGIVALVLGGASLLGYGLPILPMIILLIGLFIVAEAAASLSKKK